jgi:hypothetical protein
MKRPHAMLAIALLGGASLIGACRAGPSTPANASVATPEASSSGTGLVANAIDHALDKATTELHDQNITISDHDTGAPDAAITPQGDLLIGGKAVATTATQRATLLDYRQQIVDIGSQGIAIGRQGAALGMKAAGEALAAVFSGQSEDGVQKQIEAQAQGIKRSAVKICDRLPALMSTQQELAASLPAFKPYATMTRHDIEKCRKDALDHHASDD